MRPALKQFGELLRQIPADNSRQRGAQRAGGLARWVLFIASAPPFMLSLSAEQAADAVTTYLTRMKLAEPVTGGK